MIELVEKSLLKPGDSLFKHSLSQGFTVIRYFEVENNTRALHNIESIGKLLLLEGILTELKTAPKSRSVSNTKAHCCQALLHGTVVL